MLARNQKVIDEVKAEKFFKHKFTNMIATCVIEYLVEGSYEYLVNPEPVNVDKNTLSKNMDYFNVIDNFVKKPFDKYVQKDMIKFIEAYRNGKVKNMKTGEVLILNNLRRYVEQFKRFWKIYRQYEMKRLGNKFDQTKFEWGEQLKSPKVKTTYEDYPYLELPKLLEIANALYREEYSVRMILALNVMGRKCELSELRMKNIDIREDGSVWVKLPNVKKHSNDKVDVELYNYAKQPFLKYLKKNDFKNNDLIFPSKASAFNENLKDVSKEILKKDRITSKTLRKLGVCVAEQLNISRENVERIGGWSANSPILAHYFKRKGVEAKEVGNTKVDREIYKNAYVELDKLKIKEKKTDKEMEDLKKTVNQMQRYQERMLGIIVAGKPEMKNYQDFLKHEKEIEEAYDMKN